MHKEEALLVSVVVRVFVCVCTNPNPLSGYSPPTHQQRERHMSTFWCCFSLSSSEYVTYFTFHVHINRSFTLTHNLQ